MYGRPAPVDAIVVSMCSARDLRAAVKLLLKRTYPQLLRARHLMEDAGISAPVSPAPPRPAGLKLRCSCMPVDCTCTLMHVRVRTW